MTPNILMHIGDMTVSFALLESYLQLLIGSMIAEHQRIGQIITAELPFKSLRALAISLYKERHGEDEDFLLLRELMKRAEKVEELRNQITHSGWAAGSETGSVTRIKTTAKERHGIRFQFESMSELDFVNITGEIKLVAQDIMTFWIRLIDAGKLINNPFKPLW